MNVITEILRREIHNQSIRFVFPSETAASAWAERVYSLTGVRSAALDRFIAWDRFKEEAVRAERQDKRPVSGVIRKLFAEALVRKNAEALGRTGEDARRGASSGEEGLPFRALIPPAFAGEGHIFAGEIARVLPSLAMLRARQEDPAYTGAENAAGDDEDRDFAVLEKIYREFLSKEDLFEPSWEKPPLGDHTHGYYIFFPEALEDFIEYEPILRKEPGIHLITLEGEAGGECLYRYDSVRTEIRAAALEIRRLHETEGVPYEEMALSVPGLEDMSVYLLRELGLYNIPVRRRSGRVLAEYGTGKVFSLINDCGVNLFSFPSLKSLVLNEQLPWLYPKLNTELVEFGVRNNCVSGYREKGRPVDVWEAAFKSSPREEKLRNYYGVLKSSINSLRASRSFRDLRNRYFAFRNRVWGNTFSEEGNAVLARCVEELSALIQLEEDYPDLVPPSPFSFFLSVLKEKQYVPVQSGGGVNIFPYRVAAASPFTCHFILNAAQDAAAVLYQPLKFLRQDKRKRLGLTDTDASAAFFRLYRPAVSGASLTRFSVSDRTFAGWALPHSFFTPAEAPPLPADPFAEELDWWGAADPASFPAGIFPVQRRGFGRWKNFLSREVPHKFNFLDRPLAPEERASGPLGERINRLQWLSPEGEGSPASPAYLKVSATDLNQFFYCPCYWLYRKIFGLEEYAPEAKLLDDISLGLLYHEILKNLFARIKAEDRCFLPEHLDRYRQWASDCAMEAARRYPAFQGPLAVPLLVSQSRAMARKIFGLLKAEAKYFPGYAVADLECSLALHRGDILLNGRLDRVSFSPEGDPVILDYKTNAVPSRKDSTETADAALTDFQMPMYVRLYEEAAKQQIAGAFFLSINQHDISAIIGSPGGKKGHSREDYQETLDALETYIDDFAGAVKSADFSPGEIVFDRCAGCDYKNICRTTFSLNGKNETEAPRVP
jgi:hypothetical protein